MDKSKGNESNSNSAVAIRHHDVTTGLKVLNLLDEKQLAAAELFLKKIIATDKGGVKSVNEGLAILMRAQDLQLPFSTCIEHIHVVSGKTVADIHIIKSLLSRAGVTWDCTKDYTPQYQYTDGNTIYNETQLPDYCVRCRTSAEAIKVNSADEEKIGVYPVKWYADLSGKKYNEFQISDKCVKAINVTQAQKLKQEGKFPIIRIPAVPIDFVTEYKFIRYKRILDKTVEITATSHFSYSEAISAGFFEKDTYKKYARIMIGHRAFTLGARDIASDVLMGCLEETENAIINGTIDNTLENYQDSIINKAEYEEINENE